MIKQIKDTAGIDLSVFNRSYLEKTINWRMSETRCESVIQYVDYLKNTNDEADFLRKALNNNFSLFFRNPLTFAFIEHHILPALVAIKSKKRNNEIRIWSAACAAGQEAFSIAILCDELVKNQNGGVRFRIFATDLSDAELEKAHQGIYTENALRNVTFDRMKNYFTQKGDSFIVNPQLKDYIDFSTFDLLDEACDCPMASIFGNFDIVICANLLFYYNSNAQKRILRKVDNCLASKGFLIVGEAEKEIAENKIGYFCFNHLPVLQKPG